MSCDRSVRVLHAYFDDELDALAAAEFDLHLASCAECANSLDALKSLRSSIAAAQLYEITPASLRKELFADLNPARPLTTLPARNPWRWLALAAALLLVALTSWQVVSRRPGRDAQSALAAAIVDAHLRSLQPGHLTDVVSSDQHTVKPWFDGKLNLAPPVKDFAEQGFPLQGGRLDVVHGRTVAALVYGRRKHFVSVFIWPAPEHDAALHAGSLQGYRWTEWYKNGMAFCAVSDADASDLQQLQQLFSEN